MARAENDEVDVDAVNKTEDHVDVDREAGELNAEGNETTNEGDTENNEQGDDEGAGQGDDEANEVNIEGAADGKTGNANENSSEKEAEEVDVNSDADNISDSNGND